MRNKKIIKIQKVRDDIKKNRKVKSGKDKEGGDVQIREKDTLMQTQRNTHTAENKRKEQVRKEKLEKSKKTCEAELRQRKTCWRKAGELIEARFL